jgi:hypothetical protein
LVKDQKSGKVLVEALGDGGLVYQEYGEGIDFYNTPEAPISGYSRQLPADTGAMGVFYALARDGKHYAKVRLRSGAPKRTKLDDLSHTLCNGPISLMEQEALRLQWGKNTCSCLSDLA